MNLRKPLCLLLCCCAVTALYAETPAEPQSRLEAGYSQDYLYGYSSYAIDGKSWSSRLEWPINVQVSGPDLRFRLEKDTVLEMKYRSAGRQSSGKLNDYDYDNYQMGTMGEIPTMLAVQTFDICLKSRAIQMNTAAIEYGIGYTAQYFSWQANGDLIQHIYDASFAQTFNTPVGSSFDGGQAEWDWYKINYQVPYFLIDVSFPVSKGIMATTFAKFMCVQVTDEDNHIQRAKLSTSIDQGTGFSLGMTAEAHFFKRVYGTLSCEYTKLDATGTTDQYWYGLWGDAPMGTHLHGIATILDSSQLDVQGKISLKF